MPAALCVRLTPVHIDRLPLLQSTDDGLWCEAGGFYVDPWRPVDRAVLTHAHADHARWGSKQYLVAEAGLPVFRARLGDDARIDTLPYGECIDMNGVRVSLHPAGHILGSAQVRIEHRGEVWVVSGDYKTGPDRTCAPFEVVRCNTFVTECTFGLPVYRWRPQETVFAEINEWWRRNREDHRASVLFAYALGKAQRVLSGLDPSIGPIYMHGALYKCDAAYRHAGVSLPPIHRVSEAPEKMDWSHAMILAPPSANGTPWMRRFGDVSTAFASGWMQLRGARRRRGVDRGFVLSDHADWPGLNDAIAATGAERVLATHGSTGVLVRWLQERGLDAAPLATPYEGETDESGGTAEEEEETGVDMHRFLC